MKAIVFSLFLLLSLSVVPGSRAEVTDPFDNDLPSVPTQDEEEQLDRQKTPDQLIVEAEFLLEEQRPLDARTKLLRALEKDPSSFRAHMLLAEYYMVSVGHFRLSLKHIKQAEHLFEESKGEPPYEKKEDQLTHAQLIYLLSQARLNLDDYQGSLDVLDQFKNFGYTASWYPGTRAWVLMKLGKVDEAIRVARLGALAGAEPGRTLNMLGILLSMHGERDESIRIFRDAIAYELSQGTLGQPATPLNNSGEVYKEVFDEDHAESSWLKATSMPDGCEHVLPSLNLALLYIDELNLSGAKRAMDNFEACVAQYPLRNGEEHKALVNLARARIALLSGHPDDAIGSLAESLENRQWFGKIGTNEGDLKAAALVSMGQAYRAKTNMLESTLPVGIFDRLRLLQDTVTNKILSWWYFRKARHVLAADLNDFEDISIRNTDSLLEYPTLGEALEGFSRPSLRRKISEERFNDPRKNAASYYSAYLAENLLANGEIEEGLAMVRSEVKKLRPKYDDLLLIHLLGTALGYLPEYSQEYADYAERIFTVSHPALRLYGARLPVTVSSSDSSVIAALKKGGFLPVSSERRLFRIDVERGPEEYSLTFTGPEFLGGRVKAHGSRLEEVVNRLGETIFSEVVL